MNEKIDKAFKILDSAASLHGTDDWGVAFSGGKDSTVMVDIFLRWCAYRGIDFRGHYLFGNTGQLFDETLSYVQEMEDYWGIQFVPMQPSPPNLRYLETRGVRYCCHMLKTVPLRETTQKLGIGTLIVGIRADESSESSAPIHRGTFLHGKGTWSQIRVKPIFNFTEDDIWEYIEIHGTPYNSLYDNRGVDGRRYRSLGCAVCTEMVNPDDDERAGRSINREDGALEFERKYGYFRA